MTTSLISLGTAANTSTGFAPATLPDWIGIALGAGVLLAIIGLIAVLAAIRDRMPKSSEHPKKEFVRMLCDQVWKHTDAITNVFGERMRLQPVAIEQLRVLVRLLREDLSAPVHFVDQMGGHSTKDWPKLDLFQAFSNWAGLIRSLESQLSDLQAMISYPVVKEPVDKSRDDRLVALYLADREILQRAIDKLRNHAFDVCAAAKPHLAKKGHKHGHGDHDEEEEAHPDCPCCRKREGDHGAVRVESPIILPPAPPAPPPPPPPAPAAAKACVCVAPIVCHCARACVCSCSCAPAPVPAKA